MTNPPSENLSITVQIPLKLRRRGGRKVITAPDGVAQPAISRPRIDGTLLRAVVQAFAWKRLLESGRHITVTELAASEKLNISYVAHVLKLTLLAPVLVEAVLDGRQPPTMQLQSLVRKLPDSWIEQRARF